jgi:hypothetical protein
VSRPACLRCSSWRARIHRRSPGDSDDPASRTTPYNDSMDRGYLLAAYDQAAFKATDAVLAFHPPQARRRYQSKRKQ